MIFSRTFAFSLIALALSIEANAQAILPIKPKKIQLILPFTSIIVYNASADSIRKKPFTYRDNRIPRPLFVANGKFINVKKLAKISPQRIASIEIFRGEQAIDKFGLQGKNGAIVIFMKKRKWFNCK